MDKLDKNLELNNINNNDNNNEIHLKAACSRARTSRLDWRLSFVSSFSLKISARAGEAEATGEAPEEDELSEIEEDEGSEEREEDEDSEEREEEELEEGRGELEKRSFVLESSAVKILAVSGFRSEEEVEGVIDGDPEEVEEVSLELVYLK